MRMMRHGPHTMKQHSFGGFCQVDNGLQYRMGTDPEMPRKYVGPIQPLIGLALRVVHT
jgi:hypothetical protein